uniref:Bestrophin homolog n=1 Tax=Setaria digitata TaxID=48799 RepID=A0A915Q0L7_9BILA
MDEQISIPPVGQVGKSALVGQFLWEEFIKEYRPTIEEFNWIEYKKDDSSEILLQVIDSSGSHDFLAMRHLYARMGDAFIIVFAVDDPISFDEAKSIVEEIRARNTKKAPILLAANKIDLYESEENWATKESRLYAFENKLHFAALSATNLFQVTEIFRRVLSEIGNFQPLKMKKRRQSMPNTRISGYTNIEIKDIERLARKHAAAKKRFQFEQIAITFDQYTKLMPLTFLLGFYVSNVVVSREISSTIRRRFPSLTHLVESGLLTDAELKVLNETTKDIKNVRWMMPLHWVQQIIVDEVNDNAPSQALVNHFMQELKAYRISFRKLFSYDWICVPLVYTQVAALATYAYFGFCLLGRQYLDPAKKYKNYEVDLVIPIFTIVQFLFFVGWFKVGQDLMRPFGMDDDDFELDYIFERNVSVSFAIVDRLQMNDYGPYINNNNSIAHY